MKVRIYKPHTHAGKKFNPPAEGMDVDLPEHAIKWLRDNTKVLDKPKTDPAPAAPQA